MKIGKLEDYLFGKFIRISEQSVQFQKFAQIVSGQNLEGLNSLQRVNEINPNDVDKRTGLKKNENKKPAVVISAGGGENDPSLFTKAVMY